MVAISTRSCGRRWPSAALLVVLVAIVASTAVALTEQAAYNFESFILRTGAPLSSRAGSLSVNPRYHRILNHEKQTGQEKTKTNTALFTVTEDRVVAAHNPRNGEIVWRQKLLADAQGMWLDGDTCHVITGNGGEKLQVFHAHTGFLLWSKQLLSPGSGKLSNEDHANGTLQDLSQREIMPNSDIVFHSVPGYVRWDPIVLNDGDTVRKLDAENGKEIWKFSRRANGENSDSSPSFRLVTSGSTHVHLLSLVPQSASAFGVQHQVLSVTTGSLLYTAQLPGVLVSRDKGAADIVALGLNPREGEFSDGPAPHILWLHTDKTIRSLPLALPPIEDSASFSPKKVTAKTLYAKAAEDHFAGIKSLGLPDTGLVVATRGNGMAEVIALRPSGKEHKLSSLWEFEEMQPSSIFCGALDRKGDAYLNRVYFNPDQLLLNVHLFWADAYQGQGQVTGFSFRWDHDKHGDILTCPFEVNAVSAHQLASRHAFVTGSGSLQMIQDDKHQWVNEEALTTAQHVAFVDVPRRARPSGSDVSSAEALQLLLKEGPFNRLFRHLRALQNIPGAINENLKTLLRSATTKDGAALAQVAYDDLPPPPTAAGMPATEFKAPTVTKRAGPKKPAETYKGEEEPDPVDAVAPRQIGANTTANLYSDKWGQRQIMVSASGNGKLYAQDTGLRSRFVWELSLIGFGNGEWGAPVPQINVTYLGLVKEARAVRGQNEPPLMYALADVKDPSRPLLTQVWEFDPLTGDFVDQALGGKPFFIGPTLEARKLKGLEGIGAIDTEHRLHLWPKSNALAQAFMAGAETTGFHYTQVNDARDELNGYFLRPASEGQVIYTTLPLQHGWTWKLPKGERVISTHTSSSLTDAPVASLGRSINDWFLTQMPKLLDSAMLAVLTYSSAEVIDSAGYPARGTLRVHLVDQSTGAVLHTLIAPDAGSIDLTNGAHVTFEENWLTLGYNVRNDAEVVGSRLVSIEYFDEEPVLDRSLSNWFSKSLTPRADINSKDGKARGRAVLTRAKSVSSASKSFIGPFDWSGIRALGLTETLHNAADRALLVYTTDGEIAAVPRKLLDPRRPFAKGSEFLKKYTKGKQSRKEADSLLMPYDPILADDEKRYLTHGLPLLPNYGPDKTDKKPKLVSRRTHLESTTLILLLGSTDFFLTKLTTGGDFDLLSSTFNKAQLVGTILVLGVAYLVTKPIVKGKALRARWA